MSDNIDRVGIGGELGNAVKDGSSTLLSVRYQSLPAFGDHSLLYRMSLIGRDAVAADIKIKKLNMMDSVILVVCHCVRKAVQLRCDL